MAPRNAGARVAASQNRPAATTTNSWRRTIPYARPAAARHPALHPLPAQPGRVLGQPQRRPDGAPPLVPVLLPRPRPGLPSRHTVQQLEQREDRHAAVPRRPPTSARHSPATVTPGPEIAASGQPTHGQGGCEGRGPQAPRILLVQNAHGAKRQPPHKPYQSPTAARQSQRPRVRPPPHSPADGGGTWHAAVPQIRFICAQPSTRSAQLTTAHSIDRIAHALDYQSRNVTAPWLRPSREIRRYVRLQHARPSSVGAYRTGRSVARALELPGDGFTDRLRTRLDLHRHC
jgi:hypothetical protein